MTDKIGLCVCGHTRSDHWLGANGTGKNGACILLDECGCLGYSPALFSLNPQNHQEADGGTPRTVTVAATAAIVAAILGALVFAGWWAFRG